MKLWTAFYDYTSPHLPGCPVAALDIALRQSAIEFCELSLAWKAEHDPIAVVAGTAEYPFVPPAEAVVHAITYAQFDDDELQITGETGILIQNWRTSGNGPSNFVVEGKDGLIYDYGNTTDSRIESLGQSTVECSVPIANPEQVSLMKRGDIDAAWAPEPWGQRLITEAGATLVAEEKDLWPQKRFTLTVVVTTPEFLAQHADIVERILRVHIEWTQKLARSPDGHLEPLGDALFALTGKRLPPGVLPAAMKRIAFVMASKE